MPISQFNEYEIISEYFGCHKGRFIDIGASGGVSLSNTFQLGLNGWGGLLVEASPIHFQNLVANFIHRGGFEFLNAAMWTERKLMEFHLNSGFYSSLIQKDEANLYHSHYWVPTVIADDLWELEPEPDFISLDIEGADLAVFPSLLNRFPRCKLFCVEHANQPEVRKEWLALFENRNLRIVSETPENYIIEKL